MASSIAGHSPDRGPTIGALLGGTGTPAPGSCSTGQPRAPIGTAAQRRKSFADIVGKGGVVRLRAIDAGEPLLAEALSDCAALGHRPLVEVSLRRFTAPDFQADVLPLIRGAVLVHTVPAEDAAELAARLSSLPDAVFAGVKRVRVVLSREALASSRLTLGAVPEVYKLGGFLAARGVAMTPPPELAHYLLVAPPSPPTGMVEPTNACNLTCPTCPTGQGKIAPKPQMTLDRFDAVIADLLPELTHLALWNYGEPLLHRELPAMIARAKAAGVRWVKVSSNAHFLDGERGRALLRSRLDVLILAVDGASEETYQTFRKDGSFARVAEQVAWLCAEKKRLGLKKPSLELQFIVMRHNEHEIEEIRRLCAEWGIDKLRLKSVGVASETRDLVPTAQLFSRYREDRKTPIESFPFCPMAWDHTVVNVDGRVTPCCHLYPDMGDEFVMGNAFETSFQDVWHGEKYRAFRAAMLTGREKMPGCNTCRGATADPVQVIEEVRAPAAGETTG
jgi:radical SAM protein with 4Fe4S-binding SPASM domain